MGYVRCTRCRGQKEVKGLGGIVKKCPECNGVGYLTEKIQVKNEEVVPKNDAEIIEKTEPVVKEIKRRGPYKNKQKLEC